MNYIQKYEKFFGFYTSKIEIILDELGLKYDEDREYFYTQQKDGFSFQISKKDGDIQVKSTYYGGVYKIDYVKDVSDLKMYITKIYQEKPNFTT